MISSFELPGTRNTKALLHCVIMQKGLTYYEKRMRLLYKSELETYRHTMVYCLFTGSVIYKFYV